MTTADIAIPKQFSRIAPTVDVKRALATCVMCFGCGGAMEGYKDLARQGIGKFIFFDPDIVEEVNLATQGFDWTDVGSAKVDAAERHVKLINPNAMVMKFPMRVQDLNKKKFVKLLTQLRPIILAYTDDLKAQHLANLLALRWGFPMIAAQIWKLGTTAEIIFTHPGIPMACARCILQDRYEMLETGRIERAESFGTPIPTIALLNANCTELILGMVHAGTDNPRFGKMIESLADRNFIAIKCDPSCPEKVFGAEQFFHPQRFGWTGSATLRFPVNPTCPDCKGMGTIASADWITDCGEIVGQ